MEEFKVLDFGFVKVVDKMGDDNAVVQAARISYGNGLKSPKEDEALIRYLMKHYHTSPFEMCEIKLHVKLPIFVARQWIRHRTANINEYSGRYSVMHNEFYIPNSFYTQSQNNKQGRTNEEIGGVELARKSCEFAFACYENLIESGVAKESARIILPLNTYTEWYWKIDLHNLLHFLKLRLDPTAQFEMREYAKVILKVVEKWVPISCKAFMDYRMNTFNLSAQGIEVIKALLKGEDFAKVIVSQRELKELKDKFEF